jgi:osmotically-inducible protein OsmY
MSRAGSFLRGALAGGALAYFFDPERGRARRTVARERALAFLRRRERRLARASRGAGADASGHEQEPGRLHEEPTPRPGDRTLAEKVETEIFRDPTLPKGQIDVHAEQGVVYLHGEVQSRDLVEELERATRRVQGVVDVHNLLHLPGEPAPGRTSG